MSKHSRIPTGRLQRLAKLAAAGAKTGASLLLERDGSSTANQTAEVLGNLRALAAKAGQMASYVDGVIPEQHRDTYEAAMKGLRNAAPTSSPEEVHRLIEEELRAPLDRLFAEWNEIPVASASIGQVHKARLNDGTEVAVKVQHPGVVKAMESDLANSTVIDNLIYVMGGYRFNSKAQVAEVRKRLREELDYRLEAKRIDQFRQFHADEPHIHIPRVFHDRSAERVLTTEYMHGAHFDAAAAASESDRRKWSSTLWRFVFKGNLVGGAFNADPHPGNYIFNDSGHVSFVDFGCVQDIHPHHLKCARKIHHAAIHNNFGVFREGGIEMFQMKPGRLEKLAVEYMRFAFNPLFDSPYLITRDYAAKLVHEMKEMTMAARKMGDDEIFAIPPEMVLLNRLQFGFYSVLARLNVEVDYREVERSFFHLVPLS
ncbi:MAG: protein kinase UbiB [Myxococcota bacterium]|nr:protein kinase UbiB [Myxococcota bacterium]